MEPDVVPGILPIRIGGLGNQIFIVVAGYITAKELNVPLYIQDMTCEAHQTVKEDYNNSIFWFGTPCNKLSYPPFSPEVFSAWSPKQVRPGTSLSSYFQYYPAILPYEDEIRALLLKGLEPYRCRLKERYPDIFAFVHVRRGDYIRVSHIHYVQPIEYFERAVAMLSVQKVLVMSDDIDWVAAQPLFQDNRFQLVRGLDELESLALMTLCTEAVCSNSTFSWWGAFLGAHATRNRVIVPQRWINPSYFSTEDWPRVEGVPVPNLFPKEWIILPG